jgi:hypothetical protein
MKRKFKHLVEEVFFSVFVSECPMHHSSGFLRRQHALENAALKLRTLKYLIV